MHHRFTIGNIIDILSSNHIMAFSFASALAFSYAFAFPYIS